ncbi:MAG TPA: hypothetical protein PKW18_07880 [Candidatus Sumerlaeota bacterium]|nr:MAG: hypothetical protein BWY12_01621 [candidate division BRC1 bacterium ADurb.Bin183]HOE63877.1 hypothetical protein [Candidatus Sumerlaeota bacterium]HRR31939.1 hypothetical protein [Candidatus Sumerlaeia bacterium]HON49981.1 hypothetical protein [Candidatus Sumerlaeota bacterium]HOR63771.1 hypothetical protein [Candidatus Sumerlaeota bacterium]
MQRLFFILVGIISLSLFSLNLYAQTSTANPAEEVFGKNFKLEVDETSGTLKYNFSEKTNALDSIEAVMNVHLVSDKLELLCDELYYDAKAQKINAKGKQVKIIQGMMTAICAQFLFDNQTGRSEFIGSPEITIQDEQGHKTTTKGDKITIERQKNGDTLIQVHGNAKLTSDAGSKSTPQMSQATAPAQKMFGREFKIVTGEKGEILYAFTSENELRSIVARENVFIDSSQVNLRCERLEYYSEKNNLLALGKPVKIIQNTVTAEAGRFEFFPDEGKSFLLENPVIMNKDEQGRVLETRGDKIVIVQAAEGKTTVLVDGNPSIQSAQVEKPKVVKPPKQTASPVNESSVDIIKNVDIKQE